MPPEMPLSICSILCCPITRSELHLLTRMELDGLNARIAGGGILYLGGAPVSQPLEAALTTESGDLVYAVTDGIPAMLPDLAVVVGQPPSWTAAYAVPEARERVRRFYDEVGWSAAGENVFVDAAAFEDLRPVSRDYISKCHLRVAEHLPAHGRFLLDVASGPIQYDEYMTYSAGYEYRICADISLVALRKAREKLKEKGLYVLADITRLPFKEASIDGVVSLHTIYHVSSERQADAFAEVYRTLKPGGAAVVVYSWGSKSLLMNVAFLPENTCRAGVELIRKLIPSGIRKAVRRLLMGGISGATGVGKASNPAGLPSNTKPSLYFQPHDYAWVKKEVASRMSCRIVCWRSLGVDFLRAFVRPGRVGKGFLAMMFRLETRFPYFFGRYGQCPMIVINK